MKRLPLALLAALFALVVVACGPGAVAPTTLDSILSGDHEVPPVTTDMVGTASITAFGDRLFVSGSWQGAATDVVGAHIHGPAAEDENADVVFPLNYTNTGDGAGTFSGTFTMSLAQAGWFQGNELYINIHTEDNPGGEIRGQIVHP